MGSPLGPSLANFFLAQLENKFIIKFDFFTFSLLQIWR